MVKVMSRWENNIPVDDTKRQWPNWVPKACDPPSPNSHMFIQPFKFRSKRPYLLLPFLCLHKRTEVPDKSNSTLKASFFTPSQVCGLSFTCPFPLQVTDYAIARRIVDLHCRSEASVDRTYSLEEVQRYILFARQFRPKMNKVGDCDGQEPLWTKISIHVKFGNSFPSNGIEGDWIERRRSTRDEMAWEWRFTLLKEPTVMIQSSLYS